MHPIAATGAGRPRGSRQDRLPAGTAPKRRQQLMGTEAPSAKAERTQAAQAKLNRRRDQQVRDRHEAARRWAEKVSHGVDGSQDLQQVCDLERLICETWPQLYARRQQAWILRDAAMLHSAQTGMPGCRLCAGAAISAA